MERFKGYVNKIVYRNEDNGYTVFELELDGDELTCVGNVPYVTEGEFVEVTGEYTEHSVYGQQLKVETCEDIPPEDEKWVERYLASGAIKGIGAALASRIVRRFKADTLRIIEQEPERLAEIKGISRRMAVEISDNVTAKRDMRNAMMFLQDYGISMALSAKIYNQYGASVYTIMKENPYRLADDIAGVGFRIADEIARKAGIEADSDFRIKSGIMYTLLQATGSGHIYLPQGELLEQLNTLLDTEIKDIDRHLSDLSMDKKIVVKQQLQENEASTDAGDGEYQAERLVYGASYYYMEMSVAYALKALDARESIDKHKIADRIRRIEKAEKIELDDRQRDAVIQAISSGLLVITGGPGTGKTTTINTIIRYFEGEGMEIRLAAPTGRAAKRMTEATGCEAQTIHRMLELSGAPEDDRSASFLRNEENPIDADVIIIDEMSMVDIFLMNSLLKAVTPGTRLILVGDVNQLPSVGPGNVLRDIIASERFNVVKLTKIFRQATESDIIVNAHKINAGEKFPIGPSSRDFIFIRREEAGNVIGAMITLVSQKLPKYVDAKPFDIQVLTPTRKGMLGVERLNTVLQEYLNPKDSSKQEKEIGTTIFREGDKVMQIKNNYQIEWETRGKHGIPTDRGMGVFNGDMGVVDNINFYSEKLTVKFEDDRYVEYPFKQLDELELAYAVTVHKSQGSEYPAVVIPLLSGPRMLMNRNILYTAVTRAKKCVCIVGTEEVFYGMVENGNEQKRYSTLAKRIQECG
ncbi:helicase RecD/TraA family [Firmicutes bacterium CAG:882]|nr:helicase RecD/TraA family [Firmicutes bacterium CAG:882]